MTKYPDFFVVFETREDEPDTVIQRGTTPDLEVAEKVAIKLQREKGEPVKMMVVRYKAELVGAKSPVLE